MSDVGLCSSYGAEAAQGSVVAQTESKAGQPRILLMGLRRCDKRQKTKGETLVAVVYSLGLTLQEWQVEHSESGLPQDVS